MSSFQDSSSKTGDVKLMTISTENLKDKLNEMYDAMRARPRAESGTGLFEYLWDLKELALLEKRQSVQVPTTWLRELEDDFDRIGCESELGH
jgi:hypothetical protein